MFRNIQNGIAIAMLISLMGFEPVSAQEKAKALELARSMERCTTHLGAPRFTRRPMDT